MKVWWDEEINKYLIYLKFPLIYSMVHSFIIIGNLNIQIEQVFRSWITIIRREEGVIKCQDNQ